MRIIHLSDLHLGKNIFGFPMEESQEDILNKILKITKDEKADAVIIAGDIYDRNIPNEKAVALFDNFLTSLMKSNVPTLVISGNHDSAERVSFGNRIMEASNIFVASAYEGEAKVVTLKDEYGPINFYLLPFFRLSHIRSLYKDEEIEDHTKAMKVIIEHMNINKDERNVLVCHQFITGASTCESEEINVGGLDNIDAAVFKDFDYVALGHIHGPQNVGGDERICYCGTPLKYSFSEVNHKKSVKIIDFFEKGKLEHYKVPLVPLRDMVELKGSFDELMSEEKYSKVNLEDYVHIILTDEIDVLNGFKKLQSIYKNLMKLDYDNTRTRNENKIENFQATIGMNPLQLVHKFYEYRNGKDMNEEESEYIKDIVEKIWEGEE